MALEVWMVSAELSPLARTGGLGDVQRALPSALAGLGVHVRQFIPAYGFVSRTGFAEDPERLEIPLDKVKLPVRFWSRTEPTGVTTTLVACDELFGRDEIYGPPGGEFPDNPRRFTFFCRAVTELAHQSHRAPDVIHCHDWPAALIPLFVKKLYTWTDHRPATVFSIHNLAYQGRFMARHIQWLSLNGAQTQEIFSPDGLEYYGDVSFMKAALLYADHLVTVSPTYAHEILTPEFGCGLEGILLSRAHALTGILNGADERVWDSANDPLLPKAYDVNTVTEGKKAAKRIAQKELGMAVSERLTLALVGRFAYQKGIDVLLEASLKIIGQGVDLMIVGDGDPALARDVLTLRKDLPNRVGVYVGYDDRMAHVVMAAADLVAVPSRYEPCGLTQMHAQRYGTIPIVHSTGGLADTVTDADENPKNGNGFRFTPLNAVKLLDAVRRAVDCHHTDSKRWSAIQKRGMTKSFSWTDAAKKYLTVYRELADQPSTGKSDVLAPAVVR
ncbi:MAG: glycogen synthase GlgA [Pseudomonadota bacterium]